MGIKGLRKILMERAPKAIGEIKSQSLFGRKIAIDASMCLYQYLVSVRANGSSLTSASGNPTSHIVGLLYRTVKLVEQGMQPLFVFDGEAPAMKAGELGKRRAIKEEATEKSNVAREAGDETEHLRQSKRAVRVEKEHVDSSKKLLSLMGIPYIEAPGEAEAQCAELCKMGLVYAVASEDMDTLTFGAPVLLKHLTFSEARKIEVNAIKHEKVLSGLGMTEEQFVDFCILLGCDYCDTIKGVGPSRAFALVKEHGTIEKIVSALDEKTKPPGDWEYKEARELFKNANVIKNREELEERARWREFDGEGLKTFLVGDCGFTEERVASVCQRLSKTKTKGLQRRIDAFVKTRAK
ncbi:MAG: flap endonuclease-1 [Amphiamblys sp. WSBS2006]|nr:MAG: flap endonuclease-1 [Amphiamblys sp. WSBS2006]